jgi:CheY-like chemotaxis protein
VLCIEEDAAPLPHLEKSMARLTSTCWLRARGIKVGIRMARSARPDVILLGVRSSDTDGANAKQLLARDPSTSHIPVIAVCADTAPGDIEVGLAAGYFRFLTQPLQSDAFVDALERAFQRSHAVGQRAAAMENM